MATILVVDDNPAHRSFLVRLLSGHGHHLVEATDGQEALSLAGERRPDLIIAEVLMPSMDGYELARRLRADPALAGITIILRNSDYLQRESQNLAHESGIPHVLTEPCEPAEVIATVNRALGAEKAPPATSIKEEFDREHLRLVTDQLVIKAAQLTAANRRLAALIDVSLQLVAEKDMQRLIDLLGRAARDLINSRCSAVAVNKPQSSMPEFFATFGLGPEAAAAARARLPSSIAIRNLLRMRHPSRLTSLSGDAKAMGFPAEYPPVHSFLGAPIMSFNGPCGWLILTNKLGADAFTGEDEHIVSILAAKAGRIYENRMLLAEVESKATELENEITERKRSEELLTASLKEVTELRDALDQHAIVAITDAQGKITFVNDKFCHISKYSREELIGQDHRIINSRHHPKDFMHNLWSTIARGKVWHGEIKNRAKDGSFYWVDTTIVPFLSNVGKPRQYVAIRADITQRKLAEEALKHAYETLETKVSERTRELKSANEELEAFSYSVSHDLRAPLRHIQGYVDLLKDDSSGKLSENQTHHMDAIAESATQMTLLIDNLLEFSRMGRVELAREPVDLNLLAHETITQLEPETQGRRILWKTAALPEVIGDAPLLRQVFVNLLSNAIKYTRPRDPAEIEIGFEGKGENQAVIFVRDNGVGFEMEYAEKLFGVFQRMHSSDEFEGTGIGLANVRRIITRLGGRTWAESKVDAGATFYFSVPFANPPAP